jgi:hypothetical protein
VGDVVGDRRVRLAFERIQIDGCSGPLDQPCDPARFADGFDIAGDLRQRVLGRRKPGWISPGSRPRQRSRTGLHGGLVPRGSDRQESFGRHTPILHRAWRQRSRARD